MILKKYSFDDLLEISKDKILDGLPENLNRAEDVRRRYEDEIKSGSFDISSSELTAKIYSESKVLDEVRDDRGRLKFFLVENKYPYYSYCWHLVIFYANSSGFAIDQAKNYLESLGLVDYVIWENEAKNQSIPTLKHFQILSKEKALFKQKV